MNMQPPDPIPVRESFAEFVREFGGEVIDDFLPKDPHSPKNADYVFRKDNVVAELKCLEKDSFNDEEDVERLGRLIQKWTTNGTVDGYTAFRWVLGQEHLPAECYREMVELAARTIKTAVRSAKKQIERMKEQSGLPQANGLLLLANDGNYFLQHQHFIGLTCQVMQHPDFINSSIDGFVYFTANMPMSMPRQEREMLLWSPSYRDENNESLSKFVNALGARWFSFYQRKIGQEEVPIIQIEDFDEGIDALKFMRHLKQYRRKKW